MLDRLEYTAHFAPDAPEALVAAAFACPVCLNLASGAVIGSSHDADDGRCYCLFCWIVWTVVLESEQRSRIMRSPPAGLDLIMEGR